MSNKNGNKRKLNTLEIRKAAKLVAEGNSYSHAARTIGYSRGTISKSKRILSRYPEFIQELNRIQNAILKKQPKIFEKIANQVDVGIVANKILSNDRNEPIEVPDHAVRLKYCEYVARVFGELNDMRDQPQGNNNFNVSMFFQLVKQAENERGLITEAITTTTA